MGQEWQTIGPPGTGKTTRLATVDIPRAVEKYGSDKVMVAAFTRAAALEIASKKSRITGKTIPVQRENCGTLHSICYHGLDRPTLVVEQLKDWNSMHPQYRLSKGAVGDPDDGVDDFLGTDGDRILNRMDNYRAQLIPRQLWPTSVKVFAKKWEAWKQDAGLFDFTDLIETAILELPYAPNNPAVGFLDEAQDFTQLELKLWRQWSVHMDWNILTGDDDQCIYRFKGAKPDTFFNANLDPKHRVILKQSWRVPREVHHRATRFVTRLSKRIDKEYLPRNGSYGAVVDSPDAINTLYNTMEEIKPHIDLGQSVMFLASCGYMLIPLLQMLRSAGLPFHNPYRRTRGDWNPIRIASSKSTAANVLLAFLSKNDEGHWTVPQFVTWAKHLSVCDQGLIHKQGNKAIKALETFVKEGADGLHTTSNVLDQVLTPIGCEAALKRDLAWLTATLKTPKQKAIDFPMRVLANFGEKALTIEPQIIVGTIHSVKGGQADVVVLAPDISQKAQAERDYIEGNDALVRLFYVGMTRAFEKLICLSPMKPRAGMIANFMDLT